MAKKSKLCVFVLILSVLFLGACLALAKQDPELKQCQHECKHQQGFAERQRQACEKRCEDYIKQKKQGQRRGSEGGGGSFYIRSEQEEEQEFEGQQEQDQNPYFFEDEHFETRVQTEQGKVQILQKFTERSDLLRGIENYRVAVLVTKPHAFVAPTHFDADLVLFVFQGRPTITMVRGEKKESHNLERGDLLRIPSGTPFYMINRDENEKLFIVKFLKTISIPGEYEAFNAGGGEDPESFFRAFSPRVLQAAFKTESDELERLFGQQNQGSILQASKEQIQKLSEHGQGGGGETFWPFHGESESSKDSFNLFKKHPSPENKFGRLFEADFNDFKQLKDLDLLVSFANITRGAMVGPYFNSKGTKISIVLDGEGYFEMACPHVGSNRRRQQRQQQQGQKSSSSYQTIRGDLRRGVVFVTPAGHPVTTIASKNNNLQILCFEVNARDNIRFSLAGKKNVVSQFDREAKELAFNVPAKEVEKIFNRQEDEFFFEGPNEQEGRGRAYA